MKKLYHTFGALALALTLAAVTAAPAEAQGAEGQQVEMTAQVVDLSCYVVHDLKGEEMHRECAQVCADQGVPLVLLGEDGNIYTPVSRPMPSSGDEENQRLRPHAERMVQVQGQVIERAGQRAIVIESISPAQ